MNKKDRSSNKDVIIDDREDLEIKHVAYFKNSSQILLLLILVLLFGLTFFCSLVYINDYYEAKEMLKNSAEVIEVSTNKNKLVITNTSNVEKTVSEEDLKSREEIVIENIDMVEMYTNTTTDDEGIALFDIRYNISNNDFENNVISTNDSELLVRFAYSFDNENWTYLNNAISLTDTTLTPLMGNYYDIAGIKSNLRIATNYEMKNNPGESKIMYWKSETVIKNDKNVIGKNIKANFKIEYKNNY